VLERCTGSSTAASCVAGAHGANGMLIAPLITCVARADGGSGSLMGTDGALMTTDWLSDGL
jgi:hypothetical protein